MALQLVFVPGYQNSGPGHWQRIWHQRFSSSNWVEQDNWEQPRLADWSRRLDDTLASIRGEILLVAHSLGCLTVAHWAAQANTDRIKGAMLVAPPDLHTQGNLSQLHEFAQRDAEALPFPSLLVASSSDPYCRIDSAQEMALAWDADFINIGDAGHINVASGHGDWLQGDLLLRRLIVSTHTVMPRSRPTFRNLPCKY